MKESLLTHLLLNVFEFLSLYLIFSIIGCLAAIRVATYYGVVDGSEMIDTVASIILIMTFLAFFWARHSDRRYWEKMKNE